MTAHIHRRAEHANSDALVLKQARLDALLQDLGGAVVAFSGGVDSAYLLAAAFRVLGERCVAATAERIAGTLGVRHVRVETREFEDPRYLRNDAHRCYFCKHALFTELTALARTLGLPAVIYGANADDRGDYRPGMRAAEEFAVRAPLLDAGLDKTDVRALARRIGLEVWDKPAAPCLASRLPFGAPVTMTALSQIEAAEGVLHRLGFREVRVRHHGTRASIEVPVAEIPRLSSLFDGVAETLRAIGFAAAQIAPDGLRSGRLSAQFAPARGAAPASGGQVQNP